MLKEVDAYYSIPVIGAAFIVFIKSFIDNFGNTALEEKLRSNFTKVQDRSFVSLITLSLFTFLMYTGVLDWLGALVFSMLLLAISWGLSIFVLVFFIPRESYFIEKENEEWELVRFNRKYGYLFKRQDITDKKLKYYKFYQIEDMDMFKGKTNPAKIVILSEIIYRLI